MRDDIARGRNRDIEDRRGDDAGGHAAGSARRAVRGPRIQLHAIVFTVRRGEVAVRAVAMRLHRHRRVTVPGVVLRVLQIAADTRAQRGESLQRERRNEECSQQDTKALFQHGRGL